MESIRYCDRKKLEVEVDGLKINNSCGAGISMYYKASKAYFKNVEITGVEKRDLYFDFTADRRIGKEILFSKCQFNTFNTASYYSASAMSNNMLTFKSCDFRNKGIKKPEGLYFLLSGEKRERFKFDHCSFNDYKFGIGIQITEKANVGDLNIAENCTFVDVDMAYSLVSLIKE
ncbi:MAG: hypothetical protein IPL23_18270 [Saprospiraceae bacterium]|nr:hypothetical protein [Saprospiraceae bacterium]